MTGRHAAEAAGGGVQDPAPSGPDETIRVVSGDPTPEELAAVTAVLTALAAEEAADAAARLTRPAARSAWSESQRPLRQRLRVGPGQWTRHSA